MSFLHQRLGSDARWAPGRERWLCSVSHSSRSRRKDDAPCGLGSWLQETFSDFAGFAGDMAPPSGKPAGPISPRSANCTRTLSSNSSACAKPSSGRVTKFGDRAQLGVPSNRRGRRRGPTVIDRMRPRKSVSQSTPRWRGESAASSWTRNDRRPGASRWRVVASRAARVHRAHRNGGPRVRIQLPPSASLLRT
jgi:hypothetical protein